MAAFGSAVAVVRRVVVSASVDLEAILEAQYTTLHCQMSQVEAVISIPHSICLVLGDSD